MLGSNSNLTGWLQDGSQKKIFRQSIEKQKENDDEVLTEQELTFLDQQGGSRGKGTAKCLFQSTHKYKSKWR